MRIIMSPEARRAYNAYKRARQSFCARVRETGRGLIQTSSEHTEDLYAKVRVALNNALVFPECRHMYTAYLPAVLGEAVERNATKRKQALEMQMEDYPENMYEMGLTSIKAIQRRAEALKSEERIDVRLIADLNLQSMVDEYRAKIRQDLEAKQNRSARKVAAKSHYKGKSLEAREAAKIHLELPPMMPVPPAMPSEEELKAQREKHRQNAIRLAQQRKLQRTKGQYAPLPNRESPWDRPHWKK